MRNVIGPRRRPGALSWPVSRILSRAAIYLARADPCGSPRTGPQRALRPTWGSAGSVNAPAWPCTGWGLPSLRVATQLVRSYRTFSPLPAAGKRSPLLRRFRFCGTFPRVSPGRVPDHPALRCPDFPRKDRFSPRPLPRPLGQQSGGQDSNLRRHAATRFTAWPL